jgi:hypothetical protein
MKKKITIIALSVVGICLIVSFALSSRGPSDEEINKRLVGMPLLKGYFIHSNDGLHAVKIDSILEINRDKSFKNYIMELTGNRLFSRKTRLYPIRCKVRFSPSVPGDEIPKDAPKDVTVEYYFYRDSDGSWTVDLNH